MSDSVQIWIEMSSLDRMAPSVMAKRAKVDAEPRASHSHSLSTSPLSLALALDVVAVDLRRAHAPPPPRHCSIPRTHSSAVPCSTSPTHHCHLSSPGIALGQVAVAASIAGAPPSLILHGCAPPCRLAPSLLSLRLA